VNLVGNSKCTTPQVNWSNTVILIVWDDWGGFYDHVSPATPTGPGIGYPNNTGGEYVYGFRVPVLVVSTYLKQTSQTYTGYISGTKQNPILYDFGSILKFIENTFLPLNTFINPLYPYADQFVDTTTRNADLSDFFECFTQVCQHPFQPIPLVPNPFCNQSQCMSNQCDATCFIQYQGKPFDPDDD
jgi:phospholipase C